MLKKMMALKCNLIDYERIVDEQNKRLIFFGRYAGMAGMIAAFIAPAAVILAIRAIWDIGKSPETFK